MSSLTNRLHDLGHDLPHNFEAEQALLGSILMANTAHQRVAEFLRPEHFADPLHGRLYDAVRQADRSRTGGEPGHASRPTPSRTPT